MKNIALTIKDKYYRYQPGEFLPIYEDGGRLVNRLEFHRYKLANWRRTMWQLTHYAG